MMMVSLTSVDSSSLSNVQRCRQCGATKPLTEFNRDASKKLGVRGICKPCHRSDVRAYVAANQEKWAATQRSWYERNKAHKAAYDRSYVARNKERQRLRRMVIVNERRRRNRLATPPWCDKQVVKHLYRDAQRYGLHVDHIVPIKHPLVCGLHVPENLRLLTPQENRAKGNRWWPDMP